MATPRWEQGNCCISHDTSRLASVKVRHIYDEELSLTNSRHYGLFDVQGIFGIQPLAIEHMIHVLIANRDSAYHT